MQKWGLFCSTMPYDNCPDSKVHWANMGPSGADRTQVGPMLAPWTLRSRSPSCHAHSMIVLMPVNSYWMFMDKTGNYPNANIHTKTKHFLRSAVHGGTDSKTSPGGVYIFFNLVLKPFRLQIYEYFANKLAYIILFTLYLLWVSFDINENACIKI